jgi:hypothetical protein
MPSAKPGADEPEHPVCESMFVFLKSDLRNKVVVAAMMLLFTCNLVSAAAL